MNIGIIVYSWSGNTLSVAEKLQEKLSAAGHSVALEQVSVVFPYPWMGGNHAIRQMRQLCQSKGATVSGSGVVNWAKFRREKTTARAVDRLSKLF